ncbi:hypothetical protein EST38_g11169 [Candolleomyces aberdarensis]|uniref:Uncharacterized protein n=1 Tax=Candolleomyces aberdarensis TaxID=2316362 RepID=A0A4Q2D8A8_9AGAR|nr:hypothetical protein EST38_g11169 [Candolleomyces aberdarensis]
MTSTDPARVLDISTMPRIGDSFFSEWAENLYTFEADEGQVFPEFPPLGSIFLALSQPEKEFAATMSYFIDQAREQGRVEAFLATCYGFLFAQWPFTHQAPFHFPWYTLEKKKYFRLELLRCRQTLYTFDPPYDWEVVLSLPYPSFQLLSEELKAKSLVLEQTATDRPREHDGRTLPSSISSDVAGTQQGDSSNDGMEKESSSTSTLTQQGTHILSSHVRRQ